MIKSLEIRIEVTSEGKVIFPAVSGIEPGEYHAILVIEAEPSQPNVRPPLQLPVLDVGPWPDGLSLRREDMYGDDGR